MEPTKEVIQSIYEPRTFQEVVRYYECRTFKVLSKSNISRSNKRFLMKVVQKVRWPISQHNSVLLRVVGVG